MGRPGSGGATAGGIADVLAVHRRGDRRRRRTVGHGGRALPRATGARRRPAPAARLARVHIGRRVGSEGSGYVAGRLWIRLPDRLVLRLLAHSGGSSPNTRIQISAATRVDTRLASAPMPATHARPQQALDQRALRHRRGFKQTRPALRRACRSRPPQIVSTIIDLARSSSAWPTVTESKIQPVRTCSTEP